MLPRQIEQLVQIDLHKEGVLRAIYQVEITPAMVDAEVARIDSTTRAPAVLAEIRAALGDDPARIARSMARQSVVERSLRARFDNGGKLHAPQRKAMDVLRTEMLVAKAEARRRHSSPRHSGQRQTGNP